MEDRILFIVYDGEVKFIKTNTMDHREWYLSLGGNIDEYDNVIRGYVIEGMLCFFKANLNYDDEVIKFATKMGLRMKQQLNQPDLKIVCGIEPGHDGTKWEPILVLKDEDLEGYKSEEEIKKEQQEIIKQQQQQQIAPATGPIIEFKNDMEDPKFIKFATTFTLVLIGVAIISKAIMISNKTLMLENGWNKLLIMGQMGGLLLSLVGIQKKLSKTKIFALVAVVSSVIMFDLADILIGCSLLLLIVDYHFLINIWEFSKKTISTIKTKIKEQKDKKNNVKK